MFCLQIWMSQNLVSTPNLPENKRGVEKAYPHSRSFFGFGKPKPMRLFRKPSFCDISGSIHVSNRIVGVHRPLDGVESWKIHSGRGCSHFRKGWMPLATQNAWPKIDAWNTRYMFLKNQWLVFCVCWLSYGAISCLNQIEYRWICLEIDSDSELNCAQKHGRLTQVQWTRLHWKKTGFFPCTDDLPSRKK